MSRVTSLIAAIAVAGLTGCRTGASTFPPSRPPLPVATAVAPAAPSVLASGCSTWMTRPDSATALVHVRTTLYVRHAYAPQAGVQGLITISSIDVVFLSGGAQVGWATQATPQRSAAMVIGNGKVKLTAVAYSIYLAGQWGPDCRVVRVYWLPGDHS
jgi:hypothetical protein